VNQIEHTTSLPESDYLAILDLIQKLHDCCTRKEVKLCVQNHLLPLLNAENAAYGVFDMDFSRILYHTNRGIDIIGLPEKELEPMERVLSYSKNLNNLIATTNLRVIGTDINSSRELIKQELKTFLKENPAFEWSEYATRLESGLAVVDRPDFVVGFGINRLFPNVEPYTLREVRVCELLHPHLIQSIKTILLNEELSKYKAFVKSLAEVPIGMGLISLDYRVIYQNSAFKQLLFLQPGQCLPKGLIEELRTQTAKFDPPFDLENPIVQLPFYKLPEGIFRLAFTLLNPQEEIEEQCWLLKLKPAVEPFCKMNLLMQENGLTAREMEISSLIRDGLNDQEIADRLFISVHTAKNHVKNIHQKLDVHTRAKLVALLNFNGDTNERLRQG